MISGKTLEIRASNKFIFDLVNVSILVYNNRNLPIALISFIIISLFSHSLFSTSTINGLNGPPRTK